MEKKAILSANQARIPPGHKQNIWIFGSSGENRVGLKRNNDHLSMRGYNYRFLHNFYSTQMKSVVVCMCYRIQC